MRSELDLDLDSLAGRHGYLLEALEGLDRSRRIIKTLDIDLYGLLSVHRTGIGDRYGHIKLVSLLA